MMRVALADRAEDELEMPRRWWPACTRAALGFALLIVLVAAGHWIVIESNSRETGYVAQMLEVQRLGTGCQRIAKLVLAIEAAEVGPPRDWLVSELHELLLDWDAAHDRLGTRDSPEHSIPRSPAVAAMLTELKSPQWGVLSSAREITRVARTERTLSLPIARPIRLIRNAERVYLDSVERLVAHLQSEQAERATLRRLSSRFWLAVVMGLLAVGGIVVLRDVFSSLKAAERELQKVSEELTFTRRIVAELPAEGRGIRRAVAEPGSERRKKRDELACIAAQNR